MRMANKPKQRMGRADWLFLPTVFITGACVMVLEILGTRVLGPFFGVTLYVWAALITVTLVALAVGYAAGGRLGDRVRGPAGLFLIVVLAGGGTLLISLLDEPVFRWTERLDVRLGSMAAATLLFFLPLMCLGMASPFCIRLRAGSLERAGSNAGTVFCVSTVGSVAGSLLTAFYLLPRWGVQPTLHVSAGLLFLCAAVWGAMNRAWWLTGLAAGGLGLVLGMGWMGRASDSEIIDTTSRQRIRVLFSEESVYGRVKVVDSGSQRMLLIDAYTQAMVDRSTGWSEFEYVRRIGRIEPRSGSENARALLIGGGAGHIAHELQSRGFIVDTVELDPTILKAARRYFGFSTNGDVWVEDGRRVLRNSNRSYDLIILDAYNGGTVPLHLLSVESFSDVRDRLRPGGLVALNLVSIDGEPRERASVQKTLARVFPWVRVAKVGLDAIPNFLFFASDDSAWDGRLTGPVFAAEEIDSVSPTEIERASVLTDARSDADLLQIVKAEAFRKNLLNFLGLRILVR